MRVVYRGHEIDCHRDKCLGGWSMLYFYVMRLSDGWFMEDSFMDSSDRPQTIIKCLKERVDGYILDPKEEDPDADEGGLERHHKALKGL